MKSTMLVEEKILPNGPRGPAATEREMSEVAMIGAASFIRKAGLRQLILLNISSVRHALDSAESLDLFRAKHQRQFS